MTPQASTTPDARVTREPVTYERLGEHSFVADLYASQRGGLDARRRLERHSDEVRVERGAEERALNSADTTGGDFVAPLWVADSWIAVARASRAFANQCRSLPLPPQTDSINLPKLTTGATVAIQTADNAAVSSTDPATSRSLRVADGQTLCRACHRRADRWAR